MPREQVFAAYGKTIVLQMRSLQISLRTEAQNLATIRQFTDRLAVIESDESISEEFGSLKASLESAGMVIDDADIFIASCARVYGLTLVTNNAKHFKRIKGFKLDNWMR
jgi:tRNA(fMet)-specific endonuclease VapC